MQNMSKRGVELNFLEKGQKKKIPLPASSVFSFL